eukprot:jgi/Orpsp1_1/1178580/evm.model.c7180000065910.1
MKLNIVKVLLLFSFIISFCNALDLINDLKDRKRDISYYLKVKNIERDIKFNKKRRTLDVYYNKDDVKTLKPVVIFYHGGVWYQGDKIKFTKFGTLVEENDYIGVVPNYILFPLGSMEDMVTDVYTSIKWTYENIKKYGGDPERIIVSGHSAGAHLILLTLFKAYNNMKNEGKELEALPALEKLVLFSGPYDFDDYDIFNKSDVNEEADDGIVEQLVKVLFRTRNPSPYDIVKDMGSETVKDSFNVKKYIFYQTSADDQVPEKSAVKMMKELKRVTGEKIEIQYIWNKEGYAHNAVTAGIRSDDKDQADLYLSLLQL